MLPLPPTEITVAEILKNHGYYTAAFGKWHLGDMSPCPMPHSHPLWPVSHPGIHGFDTWLMTERAVPTSFPNCGWYNESGSACPLPNQCSNYHSVELQTGLLKSWPNLIDGEDSYFIFERFAEFINKSVTIGEPFFAYIPYHAVHVPFTTSNYDYYNMYYSQGYSEDQANYYSTITTMDETVGQIRELLDNYGISHNTILWFTSDNGPYRKLVSGSLQGPGSTAGLMGCKATLYEGGIRVPGIIEWPAVINENRKTEFPVVTSDLLPTVCDILGVDPPSDRPIDGTSILPLLRGEISTRDKPIAWMYRVNNGDFNGHYNATLVNNQYKLFATYQNGIIQRAMSYDLAKVPSEIHDVKQKHPELFESMKVEMEEWRQSVIWSANEEVKCVGYSISPSDSQCYEDESPQYESG